MSGDGDREIADHPSRLYFATSKGPLVEVLKRKTGDSGQEDHSERAVTEER